MREDLAQVEAARKAVGDDFALRIAIGNLRTTRDDVRAVYELVRSKARSQTSYSRATSNPSVR